MTHKSKVILSLCCSASRQVASHTCRILELIGRRPMTSFREFGQVLRALGPPDLPVATPDLSEKKPFVCDDELDNSEYK